MQNKKSPLESQISVTVTFKLLTIKTPTKCLLIAMLLSENCCSTFCSVNSLLTRAHANRAHVAVYYHYLCFMVVEPSWDSGPNQGSADIYPDLLDKHELYQSKIKMRHERMSQITANITVHTLQKFKMSNNTSQ